MTIPRRRAPHPALPAPAVLRWLGALLLALAGAHAGRAGAPPGSEAPLAVLPGIVFGWTAPGSEALLAFQIRPGPFPLDRVVDVRVPRGHLIVTGFHLDPSAASLIVRLRADRPGTVRVSKLLVGLRYAPAYAVRLRAAAVVALATGGGPLRLRRWANDDAAGLYAAFSLVNDGPVPVTLHALRYAPGRLGRGLVLEAGGPPAAFGAWKDEVLERTAAAFGPYLGAGGHDPVAPTRPLAPASLAFPLTGALATSRWRAASALDATVAPGDAVYLAITPAAFGSYVGDLAIEAYPVVDYALEAHCCRSQGLPAPIHHVIGPSAGKGRP